MKSDYQLEIEAKSEHLIGTVWYGVDYKNFKLLTIGPLKRWVSESDSQDFTHLTDDAGNIRWWAHFKDKQVNKGEAIFKDKSEAIGYLKRLHQRELGRYESLLKVHREGIDVLEKLLDLEIDHESRN